MCEKDCTQYKIFIQSHIIFLKYFKMHNFLLKDTQLWIVSKQSLTKVEIYFQHHVCLDNLLINLLYEVCIHVSTLAIVEQIASLQGFREISQYCLWLHSSLLGYCILHRWVKIESIKSETFIISKQHKLGSTCCTSSGNPHSELFFSNRERWKTYTRV